MTRGDRQMVGATLACNGCGVRLHVSANPTRTTENDRRRARRAVLVVAEAQGWQVGPHGVDVDYCSACVAKGAP